MSTSIFPDLHNGAQAAFSKVITEQDAAQFACLVGEPYDAGSESSPETGKRPAGKPVPHHFLVGIIGGLLRSRLPGRGSQCVTMQFEFLAPVFSGDRIETVIKLAEFDAGKHLATFRTDCFNQGNNQVLTGQAVMLVPA